MTRSTLILISLMGFIFLTCRSMEQMKSNSMQKDDRWAKVDSLEEKGLYRSAWKVCDSIYNEAVQRGDYQSQYKALCYQLKYANRVEDGSELQAIERLRSVADDSPMPLKAIAHNMTAESYWAYYQQHRWEIIDRTPSPGVDDIRFWDLGRFVTEIDAHFSQSLNDIPALKSYLIKDLDKEILSDTSNYDLRPSLYEMLAYRALAFYRNTESGLTRPKDFFQLDEPAYYSLGSQFKSMEIPTDDTLSFKYKSTRIFQDLLAYQEQGSAAWLSTDLARLQFISEQSSAPDKAGAVSDRYLLEALTKSIESYADSEIIGEYHIAKARLYFNSASEYAFGADSTKKEHFQIAARIAEAVGSDYPKTRAESLANNLLIDIRKKSIGFDMEEVLIPNRPSLLKTNYRNVDKLWFRVVKVDVDFMSDERYDQEKYLRRLCKQELKAEWSTSLPSSEDHHEHSIETKIPDLDPGHYAVIASSSEDFDNQDAKAYSLFWVTHMAMQEGPDPNGGSQVTIKNRDSGLAIPNVEVIHYVNDYDRSKRVYIKREHARYRTDDKGKVKIPYVQNGYNQSLELNWNGEQYITGFYSRHSRNRRQEWQSTHYFLDRAIYRPGQTLYFKAIHLNNSEEGPSVLPNASIEVTLRDANYQEVSKLSLQTNEYGSINGTFSLPSSGLTGQMTLQSSHGSISFSVEEYKRPRFKVDIDSLEGAYKLAENVEVAGKAMGYSGAPITDAEVRYSVERKPVYLWRWGWWYRMPPQNESAVQVATGVTDTDAEGRFKLNFEAIAGNESGGDGFSHYTFEVKVEVTDINGETREARKSVNIGEKGLLLSTDIASELDKENIGSIRIASTNLNGKEILASGQWSIRRIEDDRREKIDRRWSIPEFQGFEKSQFSNEFGLYFYNEEDKRSNDKGEVIVDGEWNTAVDKELPTEPFGDLEVGSYLLELRSGGPEEIEYVSGFRVYDSRPGKASFSEALRVIDLGKSYVPGETAELLISSNWPAMPIDIRVEHKNQLIKEERWILNGEQRVFTIPIESSFQEGVFIHISALKNNRVFKEDLSLEVKAIDRLLDVELVTYRDKMLPGSEEEWKLKVKAENGEKVMSELLVSMYDASLDQFKMHDWSFSPWRKGYPWLNSDYRGFGTSRGRLYAPQWRVQRSYVSPLTYPSLNRFGYHPQFYFGGIQGDMLQEIAISSSAPERSSKMARGEANAMQVDADMADAVEAEESEAEAVDGQSPPADPDSESSVSDEGPMVRKNLQETAFFYPDITTDIDGNLSFGFNMPEALTTWKFQALAHSKKVQTGSTSQEVITQKDLMVIPNPPRFLREGDRIELSTKLSSLSQDAESGSIRLQLFDALSGEEISKELIQGESSYSFDLDAKGNKAFSWSIDVLEDYSAITYRFIAEGQKHSDGEESSLPVLSNRMLVTESMPFAILKQNEKNFEFSRMEEVDQSNTLKPHALTLEFTANPIWYAVQAMPYMMEYPYDCSEQIFTRYYANSLASNIISERPRLQEVIKTWENFQPDAFLSNLEKNQELKYVILEETPWVMEAKDETERKKRLSLLLDINHMAQRQKQAMAKLKQNQHASGGWPWFSGMRPNLYITQYIISGLGHLKQLGILDNSDQQLNQMIREGIRYMDEEHLKRWRRMKRYDSNWEKNDHTGPFEIQYLYARSFFLDMGLPSGGAFDYYKKQAGEFWTGEGVYMQGMSALALNRLDEPEIAKDIMRSVKEQAMMDEELGMYWKDQSAGWYWYQAGVERHALMVEAFSEIMNDADAVYGLKQWLIFNKQTNDWETTRATSEAVYALLLGGSDWTQDRAWSIQVGSETFSSSDPGLGAEAGTGYLKRSWKGVDIKASMNQVSVTKEGEAPAWGALFYQYFEDLDKISYAESPIKIRKQVFKLKRTDTGEELVELNDGSELTVGDRVRVRMEIETDREMEYVHIKDMRSAGMEPVDVLSGMVYSGGLGFYRNTRDAATNFFIDDLRKGAYVLEYDVFVSHRGDFSNGITTIQCMYAPEFTSHSEGIRILVE